MKNIHILPTEKPSKLKQNRITKKYSLATKGIDLTMYTPQNIYITSDEEIKEGDWYIHKQINYLRVSNSNSIPMDAKKIILTTDQDLIKDGVQAIDDEFIEWFVKNPSCEEVELTTYHVKGDISGKLHYKIIVSKEKPKQRLEKYSERFDNKNNELAEGIFNPDTWGKRVIEEHIDILDMGQIPPKEEAAKRYATDMSGTYYEDLYNAVIFGAKWQQEQDKNKYSEEEVIDFTQTMIMQYKFGNTNIEQLDLLKESLEQFKKK